MMQVSCSSQLGFEILYVSATRCHDLQPLLSARDYASQSCFAVRVIYA